MNETRELAKFIFKTRFEDFPPGMIERVKGYVLDTIGAGFVGVAMPWSQMVLRMAKTLGGTSEASMFGQPWKVDVSRAALVNGSMIGAFEVEHSGHAGGLVFPAALAVAERDHKDGKTFLTALMLGYEVVHRIMAAQTMAAETARGFHNPGIIGPFASAAAVGKLIGLDETKLAWALGVAGSHSAGLIEFVWEGAMTKRFHEGRGAANGLESALLAQMGFTGPTTVLEGQYGYLNAVTPTPHPERLTDQLGTLWRGDHRPIKAYACHMVMQSLIHAVQVFKRANALDPKAIQRIVLLTPAAQNELAHGEAEDRHQDAEPDSLVGAQYSTPFMVAIAVCRDLVNDPLINDETVKDPVIRQLAKRIETRAERQSEPGDKAVEVRLEMADGKQHAFLATTFPGAADSPLDYPGVAEKFRRYTARLLTERQAAEFIRLVADIEKVKDMAEIAALIRSGAAG